MAAATLPTWRRSTAPSTSKARGVDRPASDLEVHLDVNVGGAGVLVVAARAEQLGDETAQHDELGSGAVVVDDPDEGALGSSSCRSTPGLVIGHR